jgi:hypothetical protein
MGKFFVVFVNLPFGMLFQVPKGTSTIDYNEHLIAGLLVLKDHGNFGNSSEKLSRSSMVCCRAVARQVLEY